MSENQELIERTRLGANSLRNGHRGDVERMSEVLSDLAIITLAHVGKPENQFGWPAASTAIATIIAVAGLILKFFTC